MVSSLGLLRVSGLSLLVVSSWATTRATFASSTRPLGRQKGARASHIVGTVGKRTKCGGDGTTPEFYRRRITPSNSAYTTALAYAVPFAHWYALTHCAFTVAEMALHSPVESPYVAQRTSRPLHSREICSAREGSLSLHARPEARITPGLTPPVTNSTRTLQPGCEGRWA